MVFCFVTALGKMGQAEKATNKICIIFFQEIISWNDKFDFKRSMITDCHLQNYKWPSQYKKNIY